MISTQEKEDIIREATERLMLKIPELVGNMMAQQAGLLMANKAFYAKYPEFKAHTTIVASAIEEQDGKAPFKHYEQKLEDAVPTIRERIKMFGSLNTKVSSPKLNYNGEI